MKENRSLVTTETRRPVTTRPEPPASDRRVCVVLWCIEISVMPARQPVWRQIWNCLVRMLMWMMVWAAPLGLLALVIYVLWTLARLASQ